MLTQKLNNPLPMNELVQVEKLQLLFTQSFPAVFISMANAILITVLLWKIQDQYILVAWLSIILSLGLTRLILFLRYRRQPADNKNILFWEKPYFITLVLSSIAWGIGAMFIMPSDSLMYQIVVFTFLIGMAGGAISIYSTHCAMTLFTVFIMLLPVTLWFLLQDNLVFTGLAIGSSFFLVSAVRATRSISSTLHQNLLMKHEMNKSREAAEQLARIDDLTGLDNRRAFYEQGKRIVSHAKRSNEPLSLIMMDIDHFKKINDKFGHAMGDLALRRTGEILQQRLRESDIAARVGGEEFAVLLPGTTVEQGRELAEELRQILAGIAVEMGDNHLQFTASFGVAADNTDIDTLARHADEALYNAKAAGRNRVACYNCNDGDRQTA